MPSGKRLLRWPARWSASTTRPRATNGALPLSRTTRTSSPFGWIPISARRPTRTPTARAILRELIESTAGTRLALVHGDVSPKNILVGQRGPVLLDAECAWYGDPAFDVAFCLNHLLPVRRPAPGGASLPGVLRRVLRDLPRRRPLGAAVHLESRACRLLAAMLLARVDGKSPVEYLTEEAARSRVRNFARSLLLGGSTSLAEIRHRWSREHAP
ncbi:MAG: phosphotransferase [Betaproteobacteria bacterium]|nr:phosphotransferase [Betaproteobacteria bacterium]